ncbi:MAG: energy-coupling factor ABC transporter permease [Gemmatimonadales bacterium]
MHIPDGFLDAQTAVAAGVLSAAGLGVALRRVRRSLPARRVPLIGLAAAFVFAAQMLNFPVAGGTSGHLIGAVLAAVLLGGSASVLVMSAVLILQCFLFADGGLTALGANLFNMALVAPLVGYGVYRLVRRLAGGGLRGTLLATGFAAWCSTVAAAVACAGELAVSGTVAWRVALPAMAGVHMLIGLGEALITTLVVAAVARARPELLHEPASAGGWRGYAGVAAYGLVVALGLVVFVAPVASHWPDGLQRVAERLGFAPRVAAPLVPAPFARYLVPGLGAGAGSTALAGAIGAVVAFVIAWAAARVLSRGGAQAARRGARW